MSARFTIICGPARSGKTERLLAGYRDALRDRPPKSTLWLSPTWRAAAEVRDRILSAKLRGCFSPGVTTFDKFAVNVLCGAGRPIRAVTRLMKRELVRDITADQAANGRLKHFLPIAGTGGLVDLVCEFISEFKRLEIWPHEFLEACRKRGLTDKDAELYEIYEEYQHSLRAHELFDLEGRIWSARDILHHFRTACLRRGEVPAPPFVLRPRLPTFVVVDGFTDFTRTQHEILEDLAERAEQMYVSLPLEPEPRRGDLFAKPLKTLKALRRRHPDATVEQFDRPDCDDWPALVRLECSLFDNPRRPRRCGDASQTDAVPARDATVETTSDFCPPPAASIEIMAAARQIGEIEMIGSRIKRLLIEQAVRPDDIVVAFRSPQGMTDLVGEVFERLGVPVSFEKDRTLDRQPALRALADLLRLDLEDWPFDRLLAVLGSNYFHPDWPEWQADRLADIERAIRELQIPRGRDRLIEQLSATTNEIDGRSLLAAVAGRLAAALDSLPRRATLTEWAAAWKSLAATTGLSRMMDESTVEASHSASDRDAWERLTTVLNGSGMLAGWLDRRSAELDRRAAFEALMDIICSDRLSGAGGQHGRVRVLSAESIRSLSVPHLFLAGLSERVFPPPEREDRLYSEADYARLIEADPRLPLITRAERTREEMLLFYEAVTRATERLYLSYPALDEAAQPLLPSPFLTEVERVFGSGRIPRAESPDISPVPRGDEPLAPSEFRVMAVATALEGNVSLLAGLFGDGGQAASESVLPTSRNVAAGLTMLHSRQDREHFGPCEGILRGDAARRLLAVDFSAQRTFAATELERYAYCPFRFFLERIVRVEPVEDLTLEFDVLNRGRIVHNVLSHFHDRVNRRLGRSGSPLELDAAEFDALMNEAIERSLPVEPSNPIRSAMREIDRRLVVEWMSRYRDQSRRYDAEWSGLDAPPSPAMFEVSFGLGDEKPPSVGKPLEFFRDDEPIRLAGRIDRIDMGRAAGRAIFNVIDYKTGSRIRLSPADILAGETLQLPLYAIAVAELLLSGEDALPWRAGYWYVRDDGYKPRQALRMYDAVDGRIELDEGWEDIRGSLGDTVASLVRAIRRGRFPICSADDHCTGRCPYATVCRINHIRSLEKTCRPTDDE